jgi:L-rhamnose-H+ transport protein
MPGLVIYGLCLTLVAGVLSGNFMLPMKFVRRWPWENLWLVFSVISLVVVPGVLALVLVGHLGRVYASAGVGGLLLPFLLGAGWGIAQVLFGVSIARLGLALGYALIIGLSSVCGTLVPMLVKHPEALATGHGAIIVAGLAAMIAGIVTAARAGSRREQTQQTKSAGGSYALALGLAILCGLMAPMVNYAFAFGQGIAEAAERWGASPLCAGYAIWPVALLGGLVPNAIYCVYLFRKNGTWGAFRGPWVMDASMASLMAVFWMGAIAVYSVATVWMGALGTSVGWGLFQIFNIMTANVCGLVTGEWRAAPAGARRTLYAALALLTLATMLLAAGNR